MYRRTFLGATETSIAPAIVDNWQGRHGDPKIDTPDETATTVDPFLVPPSALQDAYTPTTRDNTDLKPIEEDEPLTNFHSAAVIAEWDDNQQVAYRAAQRTFAVFRELPMSESDDIYPQAILSSKVLRPRAQNDRTTTPAEVYRQEVASVLGDPPSTEQVTDWIDTEFTDTRDGDLRRTQYWARIPVLYRDQDLSAEHDTVERPYREYALGMAMTNWGVLIVEHRVMLPQTRKQTQHTVRQLMEYLQATGRTHAAPKPSAFNPSE